MELLLLADAARRSSAGRINAVIPYFGYARQDKQTEGREPISARLVAGLLERVGWSGSSPLTSTPPDPGLL